MSGLHLLYPLIFLPLRRLISLLLLTFFLRKWCFLAYRVAKIPHQALTLFPINTGGRLIRVGLFYQKFLMSALKSKRFLLPGSSPPAFSFRRKEILHSLKVGDQFHYPPPFTNYLQNVLPENYRIGAKPMESFPTARKASLPLTELLNTTSSLGSIWSLRAGLILIAFSSG
ncbi:hypothetical protein NPIL_527441 [Nephila pilipes]|uniref:Uncharacterized protein n=1 Tax=Nephila pilipes TaxID=299642 RepID=A0A8X6K0N6_NEPPI|nr:hypothetical protein NPIL_527441 [Nephila pilipes]